MAIGSTSTAPSEPTPTSQAQEAAGLRPRAEPRPPATRGLLPRLRQRRQGASGSPRMARRRAASPGAAARSRGRARCATHRHRKHVAREGRARCWGRATRRAGHLEPPLLMLNNIIVTIDSIIMGLSGQIPHPPAHGLRWARLQPVALGARARSRPLALRLQRGAAVCGANGDARGCYLILLTLTARRFVFGSIAAAQRQTSWARRPPGMMGELPGEAGSLAPARRGGAARPRGFRGAVHRPRHGPASRRGNAGFRVMGLAAQRAYDLGEIGLAGRLPDPPPGCSGQRGARPAAGG